MRSPVARVAVLSLVTMLALSACSSSKGNQERTSRIEQSIRCKQLNLDSSRTRFGYALDGSDQPIDEVDENVGYLSVHEDCDVRLVSPTQPAGKDPYGQPVYYLYSDGGETAFYVAKDDLGRLVNVDWDEGTITEELKESRWYVLPAHAFRCAPYEGDEAPEYKCKGTIVMGVELSTYDATGWEIGGGLNAPSMGPVKLSFAGTLSEKDETKGTTSAQMRAGVEWNKRSPVIWNAVLVRKDTRVYRGWGRPCYGHNVCLDRSEITVELTKTIHVSNGITSWKNLLSPEYDWLKIISGGQYAAAPFNPGSEPKFATYLPPEKKGVQQRITLTPDDVRGAELAWEKKHSYLNSRDTSIKAEGSLWGAVSGNYGKTTEKAWGDGSSTAVDMKYEAQEGVRFLCLLRKDISNVDGAMFSGTSLEGCR